MDFKRVLLAVLVIVLFSCNVDNKGTLQETIDDEKIVVLEETRNEALKKVVINLELGEKINEKELEKIAEKIRKFEDKDKYEKVWIFYFLKGTKVGSGAWATTHFSPKLEVKILGATSEEEEEIKKDIKDVKGNIIGKWYEEQYTSSSFIIFEENGKYFGKTIFKDRKEMIENLERKDVDFGIKFFDKDNNVGEYYVILKNGELGFFNKENKQFSVGKIIK